MSIEEDFAEERRRLWALIGIGGAVLVTLLGLFAPHPASVWRIPRVLQAQAEAALIGADFNGIEVVMDGQRARLRGVVAREADIVQATRLALGAAGSGGRWAGGVASVDSDALVVGPIETPFVWSARKDGARAILTGSVPSQATRAELMKLAGELFEEPSQDAMRVAGGAPSPRFAQIAREALRMLARLDHGEARIAGENVVFIGGGAQAALDDLHLRFAAPPAPFRVRIDVSVDGADLARPELEGLNLTSADAQACGANFQALMDRNVIQFATGSAEIEPASRAVLDALASVALRCDRYAIEVAGHTDNQGARAANMALSARRAEAVAGYLREQGVLSQRLSVRGYGPDRPRASNVAEAGRALNRRIEFNVGEEAAP
jgi:OmpA-OmpF porin, OOP family